MPRTLDLCSKPARKKPNKYITTKQKIRAYWSNIYYCALMHFINTGIEPSGGEKSKDKLMASFQFASA